MNQLISPILTEKKHRTDKNATGLYVYPCTIVDWNSYFIGKPAEIHSWTFHSILKQVVLSHMTCQYNNIH